VPRKRLPTLRLTLQVVLLGLLVGTVVAIVVIDFRRDRKTTAALQSQILTAASRGLEGRIRAFIEPAVRTVDDLENRARLGNLPIDEPEELGLFLVDRLRYERNLNQLQYAAHDTGTMVAARRYGRALSWLRTATDQAGDSPARQSDDDIELAIWDDSTTKDVPPRAWVVDRDGRRRAVELHVPPFDVRERPWYRAATTTSGVAWLDDAQTVDNIPIASASIAVRNPQTNAIKGVINTQIFLDGLRPMLQTASQGRREIQTLLLTRQGRLLATSYAPLRDRIGALVASLPMALEKLPLDSPTEVSFSYEGKAYAGALQGIPITADAAWFMGFFLPEASLLRAVYDNQRNSLLTGFAFLLVGVGLGTLVAIRIARPLHAIAGDLLQVAQFNLPPARARQSFIREVSIVSDAVDRMTASLRSFGRYVPADVVRALLAQGQEARLGGETRRLTIHFSDIENFTAISERLSPAEVVDNLAAYLACMSDTIREQQGTVDKFVGDGIMAFWNAPNPVDDHATLACRAALIAQQRLADLRKRNAQEGRPLFRARIGLHTAEAVVGNFGTAERFAYTAMGDGVNLAARLEALNKVYGTYTLASAEVHDAAAPSFEWRRLDRVTVVGRNEPTDIYELIGQCGQVPFELLKARDLYEQALTAYFARKFDVAANQFRAASESSGTDRAATMMAERAATLMRSPPPAEWDGAFVQVTK
jgi:adenylate cyclase